MLTDCGSPDIFRIEQICGDRIIAAVARAEPCVSEKIAADQMLLDHQRSFLSILFSEVCNQQMHAFICIIFNTKLRSKSNSHNL